MSFLSAVLRAKRSGLSMKGRMLHFILPAVLLLGGTPAWAAGERDLDFDWMMSNVDKLIRGFIPSLVINLTATDGDANGINDDDALAALSVIMRGGSRTGSLINASDMAQMRTDFANNRGYLDNDMNIYDKILQFDCTILKAADLLHIGGADLPNCKLTTMLKADEALGIPVGKFIGDILLDLFSGMVLTGNWTAMETYINTILDNMINALLTEVGQTGLAGLLADLHLNDNSYSSAIGSGQYARWAATPGGPAGYTRVDRFSGAGDLDGDGTTNATELATANRNREAFLLANGIGSYSSQTTDQPVHFAYELVSNGNMASATNWTATSPWSISGGVLNGGGATSTTTTQNLSITNGKYYSVRYKVASYTSGSVRVKLGTATGVTRSAAGTYSQIIQAAGGSTLAFEAVTAFNGTIDDLTVSETLPNDVFAAGTSISIAPTFLNSNAPSNTYKWEDARDFGDKDSPTANSAYGLITPTNDGNVSGVSTTTFAIADLSYATHNGYRPWLRVSDQVASYNDVPNGGMNVTTGVPTAGPNPTASPEIDGRGGRTSTYGIIHVVETLTTTPSNGRNNSLVCLNDIVTLSHYASDVEDSTDTDTDADPPTYHLVYGATLGTMAPAKATVDGLATNDTQPVVTGRIATASATVSVMVGPRGPYTPTKTGNVWTIADNVVTPALPDGTYNVVVTVSGTDTGTDLTTNELVINTALVGPSNIRQSNVAITSGNQGYYASDTTAFVNDNFKTTRTNAVYVGLLSAPAPPTGIDLATVSDTFGAGTTGTNSDDLTTTLTPTIAGSVAVADNVTLVTLVIDGVDTGFTGVPDGSGNWSITVGTPVASNMSHNFSAKATNCVGTSAASSVLVATFDTALPTMTTPQLLTDALAAGTSPTNDPTPVFRTTSEGGLSVAFLADASGIGSTTTGSPYTITSNPLLDGTYAITARGTDPAGNVGTSSPFNVTIDTQAPVAPTPTLVSDSGVAALAGSFTDNITNVELPTFSFVVEAGATVGLYVDGSGTPNVSVVATGGTQSLALIGTNLSTGPHDIVLKATDAANNTGTSSARGITIDVTGPAGLTQPFLTTDTGIAAIPATLTDNLTKNANPTFSSTFTAEPTAWMELLLDGSGTANNSTVTGSGGSLTVAGAPLSDAAHSVIVRVTDVAGNPSSSAPSGFTVDTLAPVPPSNPALKLSSDSGTTGDSKTNVTSPAFTGTAESGAYVTLLVDGTPNGAGLASGINYDLTVASAITEGNHTMAALATDMAGNESAASSGASLEIDTTGATVSESPARGSNVSVLTSIQVTYNEPVTGVTAASMTVNSNPATGVSGSGTGPYIFTFTSPADGTVSIGLSGAGVTDAADNLAQNDSWTYQKDSTRPTVSFGTAPSVADGGVTNVGTIAFTATFSEGVINFDAGDVMVNNGTLSAFTPINASTYTFNIAGTANTEVEVSIADGVCTGSTGAPGRQNLASILYNYTYDTLAPAVSVASLTTNNNRPGLNGSVDDPAATINVNVASQNVSAANNGDGTWSLGASILAAISDGTYSVTVTATDAAGNVGTDGTSNELTIDTVAPVITVTTVATNDNTPGLSGTVNDPTATISVTVASQTVAGTNNGDGTWTLADNVLTTLVDGVYNVATTATDAVGNAGSDATSSELLVDTTPPVITVNGNLDVALSCGDGYTDEGATATDVTPGDLTASIDVSGDVGPYIAPGVYFIAYDVTDLRGNDATTVVRTITVVDDCPLQVDASPTEVSVGIGDSHDFVATYSGEIGTAVAQWQKFISGVWTDVGPAGTTYSATNLQPEDSGLYRCEVTDTVTTRYSPEVTLAVLGGLPAMGLAGLSIAAVLAALGGAVSLRRKR